MTPKSLIFSLAVGEVANNGSQNKRRRSEHHPRDGDDESGAHQEQPPEDPLKDATTLYVGNL